MTVISDAPMDGPFSPDLSLVRAADAVCSAPRSTTAPPPVSHPSHPDREGEPAVEQQHVVRTACSRLTADPPFSPVTLGVECQTSVEIPHFTTVPGPGSNRHRDVWGRLRAELCGFRAGFLGGHSRLLKLKSCQNHSGWFWSLRLPFKSAPPPALLLQAAFPDHFSSRSFV